MARANKKPFWKQRIVRFCCHAHLPQGHDVLNLWIQEPSSRPALLVWGFCTGNTNLCDVSEQAPPRNITTCNNIIAAPELRYINLGDRGSRPRHAHTGIQPNIDGARGGNLFRRYQTECFAMGVILLSTTLWRFGPFLHTKSMGNFGTLSTPERLSAPHSTPPFRSGNCTS